MRKILILFLVIIFSFGCSNTNSLKYITKDNSYIISSSDVIKNDEDFSDKVILTFYVELTSKTLLDVYKNLEDTFITLLNNDLIVLEILPLIYLNDDSNFSRDLAVNLLSYAENINEDIIDFQNKLINEEFIIKSKDEINLKDILLEEDIKVIKKNNSKYYKLLNENTLKYIEDKFYPIITLRLNTEEFLVNINDLDSAKDELISSLMDIVKDEQKLIIEELF